jgi:lipopolysaccharide transport system permease protein
MNPHAKHPASPAAMFTSLLRHRQLIRQMVRREVIGRYRGSLMGLAWSFFNPVLMLIIYTFVFSVVFQTRWGGTDEEGRISFAIVLFVGLIIHSVFAECINRAPALILTNANYVKRVIFPLEILPWVALLSALFHALISLAVLMAAILVTGGVLHWTLLLFPVVLFPLLLGTMGFVWFLAAIGVYIRDIAQTTAIITTAMLFLSPVFYPIAAVPERYQLWIRFNPLTFMIEEGRKVVIWGQLPDLAGWVVYLMVSLLVAWAGFWWFQRTRRGFADVI